MIPDEVYDLCLPTLNDLCIEEEDKIERLEELLAKERSLSGRALEETVLSALWRHRDSQLGSTQSPAVRHAVIQRKSSAPWHFRASPSPSPSPALSKICPAVPPGFGTVPPAFVRSRSFVSSTFTSPVASPRLAFAGPIPHSPSLSEYVPSEPSLETNDYEDYGSDTVDWLLNEDTLSRPSSSAGNAPGNGLNAAAADWAPPVAHQNEMSPHDMIRSVTGDLKSNADIEAALEANGYDFTSTIVSLMGTQNGCQKAQNVYSETEGVTIGKSMVPSHHTAIDQRAEGRTNVICKYFLANGNCLRADCRFSHDLSNHICKYWLTGNCVNGDTCIFSHDPTHLVNRMNIGHAMSNMSAAQDQVALRAQDDEAFPALQATSSKVWSQSSSPGESQVGSPNATRLVSSPRRQFEPRISSMNSGMLSSFASSNSRPTSRHRSRDTTPGPGGSHLDDAEAFPSLGAIGIKTSKKHHGKRGGHGHQNKENVASSLADVVRLSPSPAPGQSRKGPVKSKSYTTSALSNAIAPPVHVPWLETGAKANHEYLKARQDAFKHGGQRNKFLQSAAQAWNRNDTRAAKALSLRGNMENDQMRAAHREAARVLYEQRNKDSRTMDEIYVDLHGLHPDEAVEYLEKALIENQNTEQPVYAITGAGSHSKNGKEKVGKAVLQFLQEWKYVFREFSMTGDTHGGLIGIDPRSFDKTLLFPRENNEPGPDGQAIGKVRLVKEILLQHVPGQLG